VAQEVARNANSRSHAQQDEINWSGHPAAGRPPVLRYYNWKCYSAFFFYLFFLQVLEAPAKNKKKIRRKKKTPHKQPELTNLELWLEKEEGGGIINCCRRRRHDAI